MSAVRELDVERASQSLVVDLQAQVLWVDYLRQACFVNDGAMGIYARGQFLGEAPVPGDIVKLTGISNPGGFNTSIQEAAFSVVGHEPLPPATPFKADWRLSPQIDCDWVAISGRLVSLAVNESHSLIVAELSQNNDSWHVQVRYSPEVETHLNGLMFDWVELNAVAGIVYNASRQVTGRIFYANSGYDFILTNYSDHRSNPGITLPIHGLMQPGMDHRRVVNTSGQVTHIGDRSFYLRGDISSIRVEALSTDGISIGDEVYIEGYIIPQSVSPAFSARKYERIGDGGVLKPTPIQLRDEFDTDRNYDLISVNAVLVDFGQNFGPSSEEGVGEKRLTLLCRSEDRLFEAKLPVGSTLSADLAVGSQLQLVGICHLVRDTSVQWMLDVEGLWLELRDADDIQLLKAAPWWTSARLLAVVVIVFILAVLFAVWTFLLRRTVERQTAIIGEKIEQESVLNERQRMARELHDNLDQGLTGAAIQLQATRKFLDTRGGQHVESVAKLIEASDTNARDALETHLDALTEYVQKSQKGLQAVQGILAHCGEESRTAILDLRGGLLERMDLPSALDEALQPLAEECGASCEIEIVGEVRRLKQKAERHLLLVAREAATNAVRHASPQKLIVTLEYKAGSVSLTVQDDGSGFDLNGPQKEGHFGLRGMHERINRLNGDIQIISKVGRGTEVRVDLGTSDEWELD